MALEAFSPPRRTIGGHDAAAGPRPARPKLKDAPFAMTRFRRLPTTPALLALLALLAGCSQDVPDRQGPPPVTVTTTVVAERGWSDAI